MGFNFIKHLKIVKQCNLLKQPPPQFFINKFYFYINKITPI
jgi:hypothetical protein